MCRTRRISGTMERSFAKSCVFILYAINFCIRAVKITAISAPKLRR
ncbi:hypothetical protein [Klebsiella pneumoniae ISC21]|nr:hypothetical protein [Klebsiella pneumoniae ISC21]